ncbi:TolC family protein [Antarcticibacterium arcticum]|uniref:TolC family protein n=1 Tax=Antarcticibacterium arcticum TaxID=2585771 RepID=A0A5B8YHT9_9FLAO|nr:TolC family protein [Antarcticibacterium arcticum]QED36598.1 TolC family protein [Antarcticibacterium arcticum]
MNRFLKLLVVSFIALQAQGQELLTVEEAVRIALKNNYEIRIASNELDIDKEGVSIGNAGILPSVGAVFNSNNSTQNSSQTRADGNTIELDDARNNNINYGVVMDWTLFDGFRMFARYEQLKELEKLGEAQLQQTILAKVSDVMITYYDLVQQQQQLVALDSTLVISNQRLTLADNRFTIGKASKLEVLNAQVDMNTDQTMQLRQEELFRNTKIRLNQILARDTKIDFRVIDEIPVEEDLFLPELEKLALEQNPLLQAQIIANNIAKLELKQVKAGRYPTIVANTGYQFSESESSLGFISFGKSRGFNYGFSARMNIFDGFNQNQNEKIAKIQIENSELVIEQQELDLQTQLGTAYQTYLTNISLIELERNNEAIARENLDITLEKFRIGTIPTIEFRTAQLNYINAIVRHSNARFQAKLSEISLREFAGNLTF